MGATWRPPYDQAAELPVRAYGSFQVALEIHLKVAQRILAHADRYDWRPTRKRARMTCGQRSASCPVRWGGTEEAPVTSLEDHCLTP